MGRWIIYSQEITYNAFAFTKNFNIRKQQLLHNQNVLQTR